MTYPLPVLAFGSFGYALAGNLDIYRTLQPRRPEFILILKPQTACLKILDCAWHKLLGISHVYFCVISGFLFMCCREQLTYKTTVFNIDIYSVKYKKFYKVQRVQKSLHKGWKQNGKNLSVHFLWLQ